MGVLNEEVGAVARGNDRVVDRDTHELPALSAYRIATPDEPNRAADLAAAFPLLIAALPDFALFPVPPVPAARHGAPNRSERPIGMESSVAAPPDRLVVKLSTVAPLSEHAAVPKSAELASYPLPLRRARAMRPLAQPSANGNANATPLKAVFRRLNAADTPREDRGDPVPGLQSVFDLL
jgi:hypothetical protein